MKVGLGGIRRSASSIATQMYLGIGGAVALTLCASIVAWYSLSRIDDVSDRVNEGSVPEMVLSFGIAQDTGVLAAAAPRLTSAATRFEFSRVSGEVEHTRLLFGEKLLSFDTPSIEAQRQLERVEDTANRLTLNIDAIKVGKSELLELERLGESISENLSNIQTDLDRTLYAELDNQLYYTMTGYRELGQMPDDASQHLSVPELNHYRNIAELEADSLIATQLLSSAFTVSEAEFIEPLLERFEAAQGRIEGSLASLGESHFRSEIMPIFNHLFDVALGDSGGFHLIARQLEIAEDQIALLEQNSELAVELVDEVDVLVAAAENRARVASADITDAVFTARLLLLAISAVSVVGAFLIVSLFVGKVLLSRLQMLSERMRGMANNDFESEVNVVGTDEIGEMAAALEILRQHALEVQRLNLVEKLAEELQGKNEELEKVLADLQTAQDQIIMQGKLSALGEVTAGVAHEIRNPLNFVNNFSESSQDLIEELKEILADVSESISKEDRDYIEEITGDISGNLTRIRSHGERANRIVHSMLAMGRDEHELEVTDINTLTEEYALLAYHSGRATDPDLQINVKMEFDPDAPQIEAFPQDLGRVFLNMVANACQATTEKRNKLAENGGDGEPYYPELEVSTHKTDEGVAIRFKDNGTGIPDDAIEKVFNPFFTTKPTDQGTGLGLSLSNDIVRSHGGTIRVNSVPDESTEFIVELPVNQPEATT